MISPKLAASLASGEHKNLNDLVGEWKGNTKTWFEPGEPVDDSPMTGSIKALFDGRFVLHEYKGIFQDAAFEGIAVYGYNIKTGKFESAWMDTFHMGTGIMLSTGEKGGNFFSALGHYEASAENPELWGWRTEISIEDEKKIIITAYNISPAGEETKATETIYKRI